jgi:Spy/CpxP family protein refolding chaperone
MRRFYFMALTLVILVGATTAMRVLAQNAPGDSRDQNGGQNGGQNGASPGGDNQGGGGPGGGPGGPPPGGFHLLPRFIVEKLNLTDDQQQQVDQLEKETKTKLEKILTPAQIKILATTRPPRRGNGDQGGPQGGGPAGQGGPQAGQGGEGGGGGPGDGQGPPN